MMPKPDLLSVTGGYRRAPVLQIGADVYCDSSLICDVLEGIAPTPSLYPAGTEGLARVVGNWADTLMTRAVLNFALGPVGLAALFSTSEKGVSEAFIADRAAMGATLPFGGAETDSRTALRVHLGELSQMLLRRDFLLASECSVADFCAYHSLWFLRTWLSDLATILTEFPRVVAWANRMESWGHGHYETLDAADAVEQAREHTPVPVSDSTFEASLGLRQGSHVSVSAESFGTEPTVGVLIGATAERFTLRRDDANTGVTHIHFPRRGYVLKPLT